MEGIALILLGLCWLLGAVNIVCFIMVLVKMFYYEDVGLAGLTLLLTFCSGVGVFLGFVAGWMNVAKYDAMRLMGFWTAISLAQCMFAVAYALIQLQAEGYFH
ncbi:hypothetical protein Pan97_37350 [Bremerella volcania]|uniref:Uncharacterized protein n=1 Tax=Bremerella volcania TaxID=2527984 RepID=A0A518CBT9_9BACT|nr:hypothetical protein [Bremerella volcania]QDU76680.1 hypothetical protein Pan97_37350 [Bremerella volcania]